MRSHFVPSLFLFLVFLAGCGGGSGGAGGGGSVKAPAAATLSASQADLDRWEDSIALSVTAVTDADGGAVSNYTVSWSSDAEDIAAVDADGVVTSNLAGTATITATVSNSAGSVEADAGITVHVQQNAACTIPAPPARGAVAAATTYTEVASDTVAQLADSWHRSFAPDLDGDGTADMLWLETAWVSATKEMPNTATAWLSDGDGTFTLATATYLPDGLPVDVPRQLYDADINGDGDTDYVVLQHGYDPGGLEGLGCGDEHGTVCPGAPNMVISLDDDGKLRDTAISALSPYDTNGFTHGGGVADADCDGDADILEGQLGNQDASASNHLQLNDGDGMFAEKADALPTEVDGIGFYGAAFCDLDADGDPDIYVAQLGVLPGLEAADVILVNDGTGTFRLLSGRRAPESRIGDANQQAADTQCLDYDGDGYNDILKPNESGELFPAFELLRNNGDMTFADVTETDFVHSAMLGGAYRPFLHDLNADGWPDVFAQGTGDYLRIFWNNGDGFTEYRFPADTAINTSGASTTVGDFDGDGDLDIHVGRGNFESFVLFAD